MSKVASNNLKPVDLFINGTKQSIKGELVTKGLN